MKKKISTMVSIVSILLLVILFSSILSRYKDYFLDGYQLKVGALAHKIMNEIDRLADANGECVIDINSITDFDWDKMIAIDALYSLDSNFDRAIVFRSQLIFYKDKEVVYEEAYQASVERSFMFNLVFLSSPECKWFTPDHSRIAGQRVPNPYSRTDPNIPYYYSLIFQ